MTIFKMIRVVITMLKTRKLGLIVCGDNEELFEKEIVKVLEKFNLYDKEKCALQRVEIVANINDTPKVKLEYIIFDRYEK